MPVSICDVLYARKPELKDSEYITATEFDKEGLPFFSGCQGCGESLGPHNAYPSNTGFIRCEACVEGRGFDTVEAFRKYEEDNLVTCEVGNRCGVCDDCYNGYHGHEGTKAGNEYASKQKERREHDED